MRYYPFKNLITEFSETDIDIEGVREPLTAAEISLFMLAANQIKTNDVSQKILSVGNNSVFVPLLIWRILGSPVNPFHEFFLHNLWNESDLIHIKNLLSINQYPFVLRNGHVENTLKSYPVGQIGLVWYKSPDTPNTEEETYNTVFREVTLIKAGLNPNNFVFLSQPSTESTRRAIEDVFLGYRLKRFEKSPRMLLVLS